MPRKGENIRKRVDGRWEARYIKGYHANGKAKYGYLYAKTYAEARRMKTEAVAACKPETFLPGGKKLILGNVLELWLESRKEHIKPSTFCSYHHIVHSHLIPALGSIPLQKLTDSLIEQYSREKRMEGRLDEKGDLSSNTVADHINLLRWALRYAAAQNWCTQNLLTAHAPKATKSNVETFNDIDWRRLNGYLKEHPNQETLGILIAMYTGLRIGEVCGLRLSDIDFSSGILHVNRTVLRIKDMDKNAQTKTKVILETPKSECSRRALPIPGFLIQMIKKQYDMVSPDSCLITGTTKHMEPRAYYRKYQAILRACKIKGYTFHALRHSFATRCIEQGGDPKTVSEILGHANVNITLERYVHPSMRSKRAVMERLADVDLWSKFGIVMQ